MSYLVIQLKQFRTPPIINAEYERNDSHAKISENLSSSKCYYNYEHFHVICKLGELRTGVEV